MSERVDLTPSHLLAACILNTGTYNVTFLANRGSMDVLGGAQDLANIGLANRVESDDAYGSEQITYSLNAKGRQFVERLRDQAVIIARELVTPSEIK